MTRPPPAAGTRADHETPLSELFDDQFACADMIVLNKTDLLAGGELDALTASLQAEARNGVRIVKASMGALPLSVLLGQGKGAEADMVARFAPHHDSEDEDHDHDEFESFVLELPEIDDVAAFVDKVRAVIAAHDILRLKGFVAVRGKPLRLTVQAVGTRIETYYDQPHDGAAGDAAGGDRRGRSGPCRDRGRTGALMHLLAATPGAIDDGSGAGRSGRRRRPMWWSSRRPIRELALWAEAHAGIGGADLRLASLAHLAAPDVGGPASGELRHRLETGDRPDSGRAGLLALRAGAIFAIRLHEAGVPFVALPGDDKPDEELWRSPRVPRRGLRDPAGPIASKAGRRMRRASCAMPRPCWARANRRPPAGPLLRAGLYWPGADQADLSTIGRTGRRARRSCRSSSIARCCRARDWRRSTAWSRRCCGAG